jgi:two-component system nitrate/nitrite response regulator NarL
LSDLIQIVLVDDHPLFRQGVAQTLEAESDFEIVAQGASAEEAIRLSCELLPDLVLLDIDMPGGGLQAAQTIATVCPVTKIVMLTVSEREDDVVAAFKAGVRGYILKGVSARELISVLRSISAGEGYVSPGLAANLLSEMRDGGATGRQGGGPLDILTERERGILELVAGGASNKEIAAQLSLSEKTVKHYMTNILQKLHMKSRTEAAIYALRVGIVDER